MGLGDEQNERGRLSPKLISPHISNLMLTGIFRNVRQAAHISLAGSAKIRNVPSELPLARTEHVLPGDETHDRGLISKPLTPSCLACITRCPKSHLKRRRRETFVASKNQTTFQAPWERHIARLFRSYGVSSFLIPILQICRAYGARNAAAENVCGAHAHARRVRYLVKHIPSQQSPSAERRGCPSLN